VLSKVDLPAFGLPTIATLTPFFTTLPSLKESSNFFVDVAIRSINSINFFRSANSISSSLKSSSNSIKEENWMSCSLRCFNNSENPPRILFNAAFLEASVLLAIRSATASAWVRSNFPFKKALCVNSPGLARL